MAHVPANLSISIPTLIGSLLSCIASFFALSLHVVVPPPRRHFRHALIVNLLIADFINSLNNSVSGILAIKDGYADPKAPPSTGCVANAWVGQFSVQAIDFNILIISVSVLLAVQRQQILDDSSRLMTAFVCLVPWIPGLITSFVGLGLGVYGPVSGNWCWIQTQHLGLRYGLTHAWRIAIFLATVAIYTYIYIKLRRLFSFVKYGLSSSTTKGHNTNVQSRIDRENAEQSDTQRIWVTTTVGYELEPRGTKPGDESEGDVSTGGKVQWSATAVPEPQIPEDPGTNNTQNASTGNGPSHRMPKSPNLRRMLLLNGYPIAYIILWLPGMANRLAESVGTSPKWLTGLQASTQFIGLVNALTYGLTEQMQRAVQMWMKRRSFRTLDP
ncbi:hypothetical protein FBEOM_5299 [Fusarium beomiforme]|uniref:Glucose receptor Git3 N-terminal domain-containing protein n=1 Tax=Fusarium beomiforme TaxID=44412 RepID=A0A9P5AMW7_9HYPO|nr:hypothetical protein FBEOM_5299 [Fusarium beomiforme]